MKKINLKPVVKKLFAFRPDEAYSFDEVYEQFKMWHAEAFHCKRGEVCVRAGAPATEFSAVASGALQVRVPSRIGEDILLRAVRPGEYVGVQLVFAPMEKCPYDVVAATDTEVIVFKVDKVRAWRSDPRSRPLYDFLGKLMGDDLREAQTKAMILSGIDITERLRRYLAVRMQKGRSRTFEVPGTAGDLANYLGVNRCALSRVIGRLRADGVLDYCRNIITVL